MSVDKIRFVDDAKKFLGKTAVIVPEELSIGRYPPGKYAFDFEVRSRNAVWLSLSRADTQPQAYYLPWSENTCQTMSLGDDVDWFFTAQFTNCRFSVIVGRPGTLGPIRVGHTAGNAQKWDERERLEREEGFTPRDGETKRIFDPAHGRPQAERKVRGEILQQKSDKKHEYRGQVPYKDDPLSSACVVGKRDKATGWHFYAQITRGHRNEPLGASLSSDIEILPWQGEPLLEV